MIGTTYTTTETPIGPLVLAGGPEGLTHLLLPDAGRQAAPDPTWRHDRGAHGDAVRQIAAYFAGTRQRFDVPLAPLGSPFDVAVWRALLEIPYGKTVSYGALAASIGRKGAARAVGGANGRNPIAIIIPCHRVIGADGSLTGFGGGLACKDVLLTLERAAPEGGSRAPLLDFGPGPWRRTA